jgi:hypothetical protein
MIIVLVDSWYLLTVSFLLWGPPFWIKDPVEVIQVIGSVCGTLNGVLGGYIIIYAGGQKGRQIAWNAKHSSDTNNQATSAIEGPV